MISGSLYDEEVIDKNQIVLKNFHERAIKRSNESDLLLYTQSYLRFFNVCGVAPLTGTRLLRPSMMQCCSKSRSPAGVSSKKAGAHLQLEPG